MTRMRNFIKTAIPLAIAALVATASAASAAAPGDSSSSNVAVSTSKASAKERSKLGQQFVNKWGSYVQRVYKVPAATWAKRMAPTFSAVDSTNLRKSLTRSTFEGAMAEINGTGQKLTDTQIASALASSSSTTIQPLALGALTGDLVYTPIPPCRILDTRVALGPIGSGGTRNFIAEGVGFYTGQGGSATDCGMFSVRATAVAINLTAVLPAARGNAVVYPYATTKPGTASINYPAGGIVNNSLIVQIPNPMTTWDFTIDSTQQSDFVGDIVGYFAPPQATALQCVDTANTIVAGIAAGGTANAVAPACTAGYTQTATNCETSSWLMPIVFSHAGTCSARNNDTTSQELRASRTCCRVPGR